MQTADYIICGDYVLTMNEGLEAITGGAVAVKGRSIVDVGKADELARKYSTSNMVRKGGNVLIPGLVNTHSHAAMVYFRGLADDLPLREWLERHIWPAEARWLTPEFVYDSSELSCLEMLKAGITTYNDMYFFGDSTAKATKTLGMKAMLGAGIIDFPTVAASTLDEYLSNAERFINNWHNDDNIYPCLAPHGAHTCGPETLRRAKQLAERLDVNLHMHLSETLWEVEDIVSRHGKRPAEYLEMIGFLDERLIAAHCVHLDDFEIDLLAKRSVSVSHCVESNLKLASGIAPVPRMIRAGVNVSLGTDGAASNNDQNILSEMSTAAKLHKAAANDPTVLDSKTALLMATRWGAQALGLADKIGSLEKGKEADIVSIDLRKPHLSPIYDIYSHIVYSAMASDVECVIVGGRQLINDRHHLYADEEAILRKAAEWQVKIAAQNSRG
ncbi:MAG TPA: amidohydrolase family protein [Dissulfurispiraceae bacterium]|nr:amidohydrolase family protein [Dissulfurispiraceae bacterium]